mmetsp:Transcript_15353/g.14723  ORF Transcript_15353/g.14723 Transcript_15353/m.14723 type:complete len:111 (-) Transcript_15353:418-750(-)
MSNVRRFGHPFTNSTMPISVIEVSFCLLNLSPPAIESHCKQFPKSAISLAKVSVIRQHFRCLILMDRDFIQDIVREQQSSSLSPLSMQYSDFKYSKKNGRPILLQTAISN